MVKFFSNIGAVMAASGVLLLFLIFGLHYDQLGVDFAKPFFLFLHVVMGIMWIGLNFMQAQAMPKVPADLPPISAIPKIAVSMAASFRHSALFTVITGICVALADPSHYLLPALSFETPYRVIGIGMWLALIMAFNVWFVIWPNQKKTLGLVEADDAARIRAAAMVTIFSRTNTLLAPAMLYCMVTQMYLPQ